MSKKLFLFTLTFAVLSSGSRLYCPSHPHALAHPVAQVPPSILWGVAHAESDFNPLAVSPDGRDRGMFQLRDGCTDVRDPFDVAEAAHVAAGILARDRAELGSWPLAMTAFRWGRRGARAHGVDWEYVQRVQGGL
jgi:hypothetical protein